MLTEMIEYGHNIEEKVKAMKSEIKENVLGTNSEGEETGTQMNGLEQKEEINIQHSGQNEEIRLQKNEERLRNLWDNFKHSNIRIIGMQEGKEEEQEVDSLFENIMKNFPIQSKEIDFWEVQEAQSVPNKLNPRKHTPRHSIITLPED